MRIIFILLFVLSINIYANEITSNNQSWMIKKDIIEKELAQNVQNDESGKVVSINASKDELSKLEQYY